MLRILFFMGLLLAGPASGMAQELKRDVEIFAGLSYLNASFGERKNFAGVGASVTAKLNRHFGVTTDFSFTFGSATDPFISSIHFRPSTDTEPGLLQATIGSENTGVSTFLVGPRFSLPGKKISLFVHGLAGVARTRRDLSREDQAGNVVGFFKQVNTQLAFAVGGGLDLNIKNRYAFRVVQADYLPARLNGWGSNFRIQSGIVFRLGGGAH